MGLLHSWLAVAVAVLICGEVDGFVSVPVAATRGVTSRSTARSLLSRPRIPELRMGLESGSDDGDGTTGAGPDPADWRAFRAALIEKGIKLTASEKASLEDGTDTADVSNGSEGRWGAQGRKKSVAPANEELLMSQNPALAKEYLEGVWTHETAGAEIGGLLVRMPLEYQMVVLMHHAQKGEQGSEGGAPQSELAWGRRVLAKLQAEAAQDEGESARVQEWGRSMPYMYKLSEGLVKEELSAIIAEAGGNRVDPDRLSEDKRTLLLMYVSSLENWQEVVLVLSQGDFETRGVVINRPLRRGIDSDLAQMLLRGLDDTGRGPWRGSDTPVDLPFLLKFLQAFGGKASVYYGGPQDSEATGLMLHGIGELDGAVEIATGTGIYYGGERAAVDGVLEGKYNVLDFRFFVGAKTWAGRSGPGPLPEDDQRWRHLPAQMACGAYKSFACARTVALKQCLGLPKPLWHEVLELAGGDAREVSAIELLKRQDL